MVACVHVRARTFTSRWATAAPGIILAVLIAYGASPARPAFAVPGDLLGSVGIPIAAQCGQQEGGPLASVPGEVIGEDQFPRLLVTACGKELYFLDPTTDPATLVRTITTDFDPSEGWRELALARNELLGCAQIHMPPPFLIRTDHIYRIDIDPSNAVPDGRTEFLFELPVELTVGRGGCAIAWDTQDDTILQAPQASTLEHLNINIRRLSFNGTLIETIDRPTGTEIPPFTEIFGLAAFPFVNSSRPVGDLFRSAGDSLFASGGGGIIQINKRTGRRIRGFSLPFGAGSPAVGIALDDRTFVSPPRGRPPREARHRDAIWVSATGTRLHAFELPLGTVEDGKFRCSDGDTTDTDGDGLLDCWELNGIDVDNDGNIDLELYDVNANGVIEANERADPNHKDIYIEIDFMEQHQPNQDAINDVVTAFAAAPVNNPDGTPGIRLHVQVRDMEPILHNGDLAFVPSTDPAPAGTPDFDVVKNTNFGTAEERMNPNSSNILAAKRLAVRYGLFVHNLFGRGHTSGVAEQPGNDFVVSLGGWGMVGGHNVGFRDQQAGTLMHELGHTLDLHHGGGDKINCKPNYLSVMTYTRQTNGTPFPSPAGTHHALDYSQAALPTLDETNLNEPLGIEGPAGQETAYGPPMATRPSVMLPARAVRINVSRTMVPLFVFVVITPANQPIDWNRNRDFADTTVNADINNFGIEDCGSSPDEQLQGYNDWANLQFNFRSVQHFADGVHSSTPLVKELTLEDALAMSPDGDDDNIKDVLDNCPSVPNPGQEDSDGDGIGDACAKIPGDLDGDRDVDQDDLNIVLVARNQPAGPNDPRDLNRDGIINALDARQLVTLCTRPGCATK